MLQIYESLQKIPPETIFFILIGAFLLFISVVIFSNKIRETHFFKGVFNVEDKASQQNLENVQEEMSGIDKRLEDQDTTLESQMLRLETIEREVKILKEKMKTQGIAKEKIEQKLDELEEKVNDLHQWHDTEDETGRKIWYKEDYDDVEDLIDDIFQTNRHLIELLQSVIRDIDRDLNGDESSH